MISIRQAQTNDISVLYDLYTAIGKQDEGYFESAFANATTILIANFDDAVCGFCLLNWNPRYSLYKKLGIPEIQDLNVLIDFRRQGIATALIKWCEGLARAKSADLIGISVGLTKNFGAAQILYTHLGFVPDGNGITYDRDGVNIGQSYPMDDDLALMLIKPL